MIRLSVIVPFYGVERYIGECLQSLYQQNIPESEYEIICVNDCSPDHCEEIVLTYQQQHTNLRLIRHEQNMKLGAARNSGLRAATGRYVWFIDSDDYIEDNCLSEVLMYCESNELEMLHFSIRDNYGRVIRALEPTGVVSGPEEEWISYKQQCIEVTYPWNRIYLRSFLVNNNLFFNDLYGGDVIHTVLALDACQRMMNVNRFYHYYRVDNAMSDTHSTINAEKFYRMNYVLSRAIDDIVPDLLPNWRELFSDCSSWKINHSWKGLLKLSIKEKRKLYDMLHGDYEMYSYVMEQADNRVHFILSYPTFIIAITPLIRLLLFVKKTFQRYK